MYSASVNGRLWLNLLMAPQILMYTYILYFCIVCQHFSMFNLTSQKFSDSNNLLGSNDRSLRGNVAFGAARSMPPEFDNYLVSPGVPTGRAETCPKNCSPSGVNAVEYDGGVKNKYASDALPAVTNARSCNVGGLNWNNGLSPAQSCSTQQDSFFQYQNCRTFIDKASLINYNGSNIPYIFFHNRRL